MNTRIWSSVCAASVFALTVGVFGQAGAPPQQPASSSMKAVTIGGCIQKAADAPTGTSGSAAASTKFLLTKAAMTPAGATGTAGSPTPSTAVASEYRLDWDEAKLTPHVGHKVEITGSVVAAPATTQPPAASAANAPTLRVESIKMVASTCS